MIIRKIFFLFIFLFQTFQSCCALSLAEQFKQVGYVELYDKNHGAATFDSLYAHFDELILFFEKNPVWAQKVYSAKERFIRSKAISYYSTDFFGFYDESSRQGRNQISFYYSSHFHEYMCSYYPELKKIPEIISFLNACLEIEQSYENLCNEVVADLGLESTFSSNYNRIPIIIKVVKYFPSYVATRAHYDGTAFSLFLDSTDNQALLLSPYKASFVIEDFFSPARKQSRCDHQHSILLIPGMLLTRFSIYPTPHIVTQSGKTRYATIAFAMRPHYTPEKNNLSLLPVFNL